MARKTGRRWGPGVTTLAALALLLQGLSGILAGASSSAVVPSPFGAQVICTTDGIRTLEPDGAPYEGPAKDEPATAGDLCQACFLSKSCCQGLLCDTPAEVLARGASETFAVHVAPPVHRLFLLAKPGRGPPPVRA